MSSTRRRLQLQQQQQQNNRNAFGKLTYLSSSRREGEEELPILTILVNERFYYFRTENEFGTQTQNPLATQQWVVGDSERERDTNEMSKDHNENAVMLIFVYFTTNLCVEPRSV